MLLVVHHWWFSWWQRAWSGRPLSKVGYAENNWCKVCYYIVLIWFVFICPFVWVHIGSRGGGGYCAVHYPVVYWTNIRTTQRAVIMRDRGKECVNYFNDYEWKNINMIVHRKYFWTSKALIIIDWAYNISYFKVPGGITFKNRLKKIISQAQ